MIDQAKVIEILQQSGNEIKPVAGDFDKPFKDVGLDSLDVYNFLSELEVALGAHISDEEYEMVNTLNDVIQLLNSR